MCLVDPFIKKAAYFDSDESRLNPSLDLMPGRGEMARTSFSPKLTRTFFFSFFKKLHVSRYLGSKVHRRNGPDLIFSAG